MEKLIEDMSMTEDEMLEALGTKYKITPLTGTTSTPKLKPTPLPGLSKPDLHTSTMGYNLHVPIPKLNFFSGEEPIPKGETSYREWRYEVSCYLQDPEMQEHTIISAIRRSLRGTAKSIVIPLGEKATVDELLQKLDTLFGDISTNEMIMQEFFNSYQKEYETVAVFGCRLETMLQTAVDHGYLQKEAKNDMLRHKFWQSLSSEKLKSQTRHKYDTIVNFDMLLREIRMVEKQLSITPGQTSSIKPPEKVKAAHHHPVVYQNDLIDLEKRLDMKLDQMGKKLDSKIESKFDQILSRLDKNNNTGQNRAYNQEGASNHCNTGNYNQNNNKRYNGVTNSPPFQDQGYDGRNRGRGQGRGRGHHRGAGRYPNRGDLNF